MPPSAATTLARFDEVQLERGIEAVEAIILLLERGHRTFASGIGRQLFEQLVNVEHIGAQPDRLEAVRRYAKYGLMQQILHSQAEVDYEAGTGRPVDEEFRKLLQGWIDLNFNEFKGKPRTDGSLNVNSSWSGKSVRQLTASSTNAMRGHQYDLLFKVWSTQVHAAPAALTDGIFGSQAVAVDNSKHDDQRAAELLATVLNLFIDLWKNLPKVEQPSLAQSLTLLARLRAELGKVVDLS